MSNKTVQISDKLIQWEAEKNPLAPLSSSQINAYLSLSEYLGNTDFISSDFNDSNEDKLDENEEPQILKENIETAEDVSK